MVNLTDEQSSSKTIDSISSNQDLVKKHIKDVLIKAEEEIKQIEKDIESLEK